MVKLTKEYPVNKIEVIDMMGRKVRTQISNTLTNVLEVDIQSLPEGMYICRVIDNNGVLIYTDKLMK